MFITKQQCPTAVHLKLRVSRKKCNFRNQEIKQISRQLRVPTPANGYRRDIYKQWLHKISYYLVKKY